MVWIDASGERSVLIKTPLEEVLAFLKVPEKSAALYPGVEKVEKRGERSYHLVVGSPPTLGVKFRGEYLVEYSDNQRDVISWHTVSGNVKNTGSYRLVPWREGCQLSLKIRLQLELPVPFLMRGSIKSLFESDLAENVAQTVMAVRDALEKS